MTSDEKRSNDGFGQSADSLPARLVQVEGRNKRIQQRNSLWMIPVWALIAIILLSASCAASRGVDASPSKPLLAQELGSDSKRIMDEAGQLWAEISIGSSAGVVIRISDEKHKWTFQKRNPTNFTSPLTIEGQPYGQRWLLSSGTSGLRVLFYTELWGSNLEVRKSDEVLFWIGLPSEAITEYIPTDTGHLIVIQR